MFLAIFEGLFSAWPNCEPTWARLLCNWANYHFCKWPNLNE